MARYEYGQSADSTVAQPVGDNLTLADGLTVTFWSAPSGGSQYTSFVSAVDGTTVVGPSFVIGTDGILQRFLGPDGIAFMWLDATGMSERVRVPGQWVPGNVVAASETQSGIVERATQAETDAGVDDVRYVSPLKIATTTLFRRRKNDSVSLVGASDTAVAYTVTDDSTSQTGWPIRWGFSWGAIATGFADKYGQLRAYAAKSTTPAFRVANKNPSPTANLIEAGVTDSDALFAVSPTGAVTAPNIGAKVVVLNATDPVPAGTPDGSLIVRVTDSSGGGGGGGGGGSTLLFDHPMEGTVGATATASSEGFTSLTGTAPVYVSAHSVGSTSLQFGGAASGHLDDAFAAQSVDLYVRWYAQVVSHTTTAMVIADVGGSQIRIRNTDLVIWESATGAAGVASGGTGTRPTDGSWYRYEWQIGTASSILKIWNTPSSTGAADQTITGTYAAPIARPTRLYIGQITTTGGVINIDAVAIATQAIGPAA